MLRFNDGIQIDTEGDPRILRLFDGLVRRRGRVLDTGTRRDRGPDRTRAAPGADRATFFDSYTKTELIVKGFHRSLYFIAGGG